MTTFYVAARYSQANAMQGVRDVLEVVPGWHCTARWIRHHDNELEHSIDPTVLNAEPEACAKYALADIEDIDAADVVISFTEADGGGKGGRHVEFGYALAAGKRCIVVGPREHVFHTHPAVEHYPSWRALVMALTPPW